MDQIITLAAPSLPDESVPHNVGSHEGDQRDLHSEARPIQKDRAAEAVAIYSGREQLKYNLSLAGNPWGPAPNIQREWEEEAVKLGYRLGRYADYTPRLINALRDFHGIPQLPDNFMFNEDEPLSARMVPDIYVSAGTTRVLQELFNTGEIGSSDWLVLPASTFPVPSGLAGQNSMRVSRVPMTDELRVDFDQLQADAEDIRSNAHNVGIIFGANPNSPTGLFEPTERWIQLAEQNPRSLVVISEANVGYVRPDILEAKGGSLLDDRYRGRLPRNLMVLGSFSKAWGMAGERVGYVVGHAPFIQALRAKSIPFNMSVTSVGLALMSLKHPEHIVQSRDKMAREIAKLTVGLRQLGFKDIPDSEANMLVARIPACFDNAEELAAALTAKGMSVVPCDEQFGPRLAKAFIRLTPSTEDDNDEALRILAQVCQDKKRARYVVPTVPRPDQQIFGPLRNGGNESRPMPVIGSGELMRAANG